MALKSSICKIKNEFNFIISLFLHMFPWLFMMQQCKFSFKPKLLVVWDY